MSYFLDKQIWGRDKKLPGASVWVSKSCHFCGHGLLNSIQPRPSAITLRLVTKGGFYIKTVDRPEPYLVSVGTIFLALPFYPIEILEVPNQQNEWKELQLCGDDTLPLLREFDLHPSKPIMNVNKDKIAAVESLFDEIHLKLDRWKTDPYIIIGLMYSLVSTLREGGKFSCREDYSRSKEIVDIVLSSLESSQFSSLNVEEIADIIGVNRSTLRRSFIKETGKTPVKFIKEYKIIKAKEFLLHTDLKISEIASRVGFVNEKYFIRCFREETNSPPAQWRTLKRSS